MAQGKLKVKGNVPGKSKKSHLNKVAKLKKGNKQIAPKKQNQQEVAKLKKNIQKAINQNIESEVSAKAQRFEEGKKFLVIGNPKSKTQAKKK